jgi:formylmethanofuran dehydrogenase subunit E
MIDRQTLDATVAFHGHMCPGLAMGIRAAEVALDQIGSHSSDEEVVAIVETDMCGVDAIQFLTGCTFGKGNLIHRDYGKNAYTFIRRSDGKAIRVSTRPNGGAPKNPEWEDLFTRVRAGSATPDERERFQALHRQRAQQVLDTPIDQLYAVGEVDVVMPHPARIHTSVICEACGEPTMETRVRRYGGRQLCQPCFEAAMENRVAPPARVAVAAP